MIKRYDIGKEIFYICIIVSDIWLLRPLVQWLGSWRRITCMQKEANFSSGFLGIICFSVMTSI